MPTNTNNIKTRKIFTSKKAISNQFEEVKPVEVKCFVDEAKIEIETEKKSPVDVTATIKTVVPTTKRRNSIPSKNRTPVPIKDMVIAKPIRPTSVSLINQQMNRPPTNLSQTFTLYEVPPSTPNVGQSMNETMTISPDHHKSDLHIVIPIIPDSDEDESSVVEVHRNPANATFQKPNTLIGRFAPSQKESSATVAQKTVTPTIASVHYDEDSSTEMTNKQLLIQQFYAQLEQMKTVFKMDAQPQLTTNTLVIDKGQVEQVTTANPLKEKTVIERVSPTVHVHAPSAVATVKQNLISSTKQQATRKNSSTRIQSAPVRMASQTSTTGCKSKRPASSKKSITTRKIVQIDKTKQRRDSAPVPVNISDKKSETTLLPEDEDQCRKIFEKLQRLQPSGACADLNTLRRALFPPVGTVSYSSASVKPLSNRSDEMVGIRVQTNDSLSRPSPLTSAVPLSSNLSSNANNSLPQDPTANMDRIIDQMKKHANINYSYYTRTK